MLRQVALATLLVVFPNAAAAQEQRFYAGAGGTTVGVTAEAGGFLSRTVGVTFEASIPARFDSVQETRDPGGPTDNQHRDIVLSGLFHSHLPSVGRLRAAIVLGPSIAYEDTVSDLSRLSGRATTEALDVGRYLRRRFRHSGAAEHCGSATASRR